MIEGIYQIGKVSREDRRISEIAADIPETKEGKVYKVGVINFNLNERIIEINTLKEYEQGDEDRYRYVKLLLTGRQNQFFCTFKDLKKRLFCEKNKPYSCWLSIEREAEEISKDEELKQFLILLKDIKEEFYKDGVLDLLKIKRFNSEDVDGFNNKEEFNEFLKRKLSDEEIIFWTIQINGKNIVDYEFYDRLIKKKVIDEKKSKGKTVCYICYEEKDEYFEDLARLPIKFFINDKVGFSQKLSNKWTGNFALCSDCYISLFAGEKFILNNLKFNIGGVIDVLLIPEFISDIPFSKEKIKEWAGLVKDLYNPFDFIEETEFRNKLNRFKERGYLMSFLLNYVFYEQDNNQFKIYSVVKDLPNSRIDELRNRFIAYKEKVRNKFHFLEPLERSIYSKSEGKKPKIMNKQKSSNFSSILEGMNKQKISNIFSSILEGIPIEKRSIIREFWLGAIQRDRDEEMYNYILETLQFLMLLKELNLIYIRREEMEMNVPEELKRYIEEVGFNEQETALFLLGTLIADVASKQIVYGSKPILNKINFQGMPLERLKILFNEVLEKLEHEKLLFGDKEIVYAAAKRLFDKNLRNWSLKPHENVYYILSGYAYKTALNIEVGKSKKEGKHGGEEATKDE